MSLSSNQIVSIWESTEEFLSQRIPKFYKDTISLDASSHMKVRDAYMLWYLSTWDTLNSFGVPLTKVETHRWINSICAISICELVDLLKEASHQLVLGDFTSYSDFKRHMNKSHPNSGAVFAPVKRIMHHWFQDNEIDALNLCYSWCLFLGRLNLSGLAQLEADALNNYLMIESEIQEDGFTSCEIKILQSWFPRSLRDRVFLQEHHRPQHGPGATADAGRVQQLKYASLKRDARIDMLLKRIGDDQSPYPRTSNETLVRESKTIFVPKSLGSYRTISMEPATIMWHQKGVRNAWMDLISVRRHYLLRRFQPEFQQPNRDLAWEGSMDGSYATIDLSSASDTVSWNLVKEWFRNTSLYPWLLWTRSTHTQLPNGERIKLRKFAPMGSDLCFPVETYIFAAITECAIRECGGDPVASRYVVYGDDIVVEEKFASTVLRRLEQNGFRPNWSKSFSGSQPKGFFRESCGGYFFNGVDITPVRLSRRFSGYSELGCDNPGRIESLIELANDCASRYPSVRRWCVRCLLQLPQHLRPPFSSDGNVGLFSLQPTNFHLKVRESLPLQTLIYTYGANKSPERERDEEWEDIRYYEYLRQTHKRQRLIWPEDRVDVDVSPIPRSLWKTRRSALY